jgi:hypothetical protein
MRIFFRVNDLSQLPNVETPKSMPVTPEHTTGLYYPGPDEEIPDLGASGRNIIQNKMGGKFKPGTISLPGKPVKPKAAPVQTNVWLASDGSEHLSKRAAEVRELELEAEAAQAPSISLLDAALEKAKKADAKPTDDEHAEDDHVDENDPEDVKKEKRARKAKKDMEMAAKKEKEEKERSSAADTNADDPKEGNNSSDNAQRAKEKEDDMDDGKSKKAKKAVATADMTHETDETKEGESASGKAKKADEKKDGKYGDVEYADEKNKKYPIDDEERVRAAWSYINKEKNAAEYDAAELKIVKDRIIAAWKKKIDKDGPPSAEKNKKAFRHNEALVLAKGMDTLAHLAHKLEHISQMIDACEMEQAREGDDSTVPDQLRDWLAEGVKVFMAMAAEETTELLQGEDDDFDPIMPETVLCMSAGLPKGAREALAKLLTDSVNPVLSKADDPALARAINRNAAIAAELVKAGARHSKDDMERIQGLHDAADDLHKCMGKMMDDHLEKVTDLCKSLGLEMAGVEEDDAGMKQENKKMSKLIDALNEALAKDAARDRVAEKTGEKITQAAETIETLLKVNANLVSRIEHLEGLPAPAKGNVRAMGKADDYRASGTSSRQVEAALEKMSPEEKAMFLMKASLSNPQASTNFRK